MPAHSAKGESGTFFCWLRGSFSIAGEQILFQVEGTESPIEVEVTGRFRKWLSQQGGKLPMEPVWVSGWPSVQRGKLATLKPKSCFKPTSTGIKEMWYFWGDIDGDVMKVPSIRFDTVYLHSIPGLSQIVPEPGRYQLELIRSGLDVVPLRADKQQQPLPPPPGS
ncbi:MAG: hypothetical protein AB4040_11280 [Synechococcus sp.]